MRRGRVLRISAVFVPAEVCDAAPPLVELPESEPAELADEDD
jgi:hypothetical protein